MVVGEWRRWLYLASLDTDENLDENLEIIITLTLTLTSTLFLGRPAKPFGLIFCNSPATSMSPSSCMATTLSGHQPELTYSWQLQTLRAAGGGRRDAEGVRDTYYGARS